MELDRAEGTGRASTDKGRAGRTREPGVAIRTMVPGGAKVEPTGRGGLMASPAETESGDPHAKAEL